MLSLLPTLFVALNQRRLAPSPLPGVALSSVTELEFDLIGLLAALFSTFIFAAQNIMSKKVRQGWRSSQPGPHLPVPAHTLRRFPSRSRLQIIKQGVDHIAILLVVSRLSLLGLLLPWFINEGYSMMFGDALTSLGYEAVRDAVDKGAPRRVLAP
jgi:solute carrier family 35 protein E1